MPPSSLSACLPGPLVHGHRGCRGLLPENTLPAFLYATELGVDVLEMDVVISADGEVVVSHEPWFSAALCRDAHGQPIPEALEQNYNLYQLPYAAIRDFDCGLTPLPRFPRQQAVAAYKPLLREVIQVVEQRVAELGRPMMQYSVEVKSTAAHDGRFHPVPEEFVERVLAVLQEKKILRRTTLLSFDKRVLQAARRQVPTLPLCLLIEDQRSLASHLHELGFMPQILGPDYELVTSELVASARAAGLSLVPWTVNDEGSMRRLMALGVAGITTDFPDLLLTVLGRLTTAR